MAHKERDIADDVFRARTAGRKYHERTAMSSPVVEPCIARGHVMDAAISIVPPLVAAPSELKLPCLPTGLIISGQ